jgi:hypothetical protein
MYTTRRILVGILFAAALGTPSAWAQTASPLGPSITAISDGVRGSNVAYDPRDSIYLVVSAHGNLNGRFISADGVLIGTQFLIQSGDPALGGGWTHFPAVAYSPDAYGGAGGFLVTWHQSLATGGAVVHARLVNTSGVLGPESQISADGSWWEAAADIAYSTTSKEFLVVWQGIGIRAQRIGVTGAPIGGNFPVTDGTYHRDPAVVYNPANNEFMVTFGGADATSAFAGFRRVAAGSGTLLGAETLLTRAGAVYISEIAYNSTTNQYLAAWYQGGTFGRLIDASGTIVSGVVPLSTTVTAYDALGIAYNTSTGTFMMVSHSTTSFQDGAVELSGSTATPGLPFLATSALPATSGNFYPKIDARSGKAEWLLSTATGFAVTTVQRIQSTAVGGSPGPAPAPPPPPCTATPTVTAMSIANGITTFPINVVASTTTCTWTATSNASWLQIGAGGNGTGSASFAVTSANNSLLSPRSGTITVGGQSVTVSQAGFSAAAVHDLTGDRYSDIVWQYGPTGAVAMWGLKGNLVVSTPSLPSIADPAWKVVGSGDLDGNGSSDLVWQTAAGDVAGSLLRNGALIGVDTLNYKNVGPNWKIRGVGDVNGDGKSDIIFQHNTEGWLAVWLMDGLNATATLMLSVPRMPDPNWIIAGAGDINGDGKADIVWQNQATGGLAAWLLDGPVAYGQASLSIAKLADLNWKIRGVGDVDGDGKADLLWQNVATGNLGVWFLSWFTVVGQSNLFFSGGVAAISDLRWTMVGPG